MARKRKGSAASELLRGARGKKKPSSYLGVAFWKLKRKKELSPGQHVKLKQWWRSRALKEDESAAAESLRDLTRKYLEKLRKKARGASDPRVERAETILEDLREAGTDRESVRVFLRDPHRPGFTRRWSVNAWERFISQEVYMPIREEFEQRGIRFQLATMNEMGAKDEVLEEFAV